MKNGVIIFVFVFLLALSSFVSADEINVTSLDNNFQAPSIIPIKLTIDCNSQTSLTAKIKCRIDQGGAADLDLSDDICSISADVVACKHLYPNAINCYGKTDYEKDSCLKQASGFTNATVKAEAEVNNKNAIRTYLILLLYDLQNRVASAYENHNINSVVASESMALIAQTQQDLLLAKPKIIINQKIQGLKKELLAENIP